MVRDRHHLVRFRQIERALGHLVAFAIGNVALVDEADFQVLDRKDIAIAHHEIEVVERDAFGLQTIIDDLLEETAGVLLPRDPFLLDAVGDLAVAQQAGADVVVVGVYAKDVRVALRHWRLLLRAGSYSTAAAMPISWPASGSRGTRHDMKAVKRIVADQCCGVIVDLQGFFLSQVDKRLGPKSRPTPAAFVRLLNYFRSRSS